MTKYESIVNLCHPQNVSASLEQHCSAMRMDSNYAWTFNRLNYALTDWRVR